MSFNFGGGPAPAGGGFGGFGATPATTAAPAFGGFGAAPATGAAATTTAAGTGK